MTARELLDLNGDFHRSPLLSTARKLHALLAAREISYVIIGGLAVIRNGAVRTTRDVDILVRREEWPRTQEALSRDFEVAVDSAVDRETNVTVRVLFAGDDWDMIVPLPDPVEVLEYDADLKANFLSLPAILTLKVATYLQKKREEGIEIAAKDLADAVELLRNNREKLRPGLLEGMHPRIRREIERILKKLQRRRGSQK